MTRKLLTTLAFLSVLIALIGCGAQTAPTSESPTAAAPAVAKPIVVGDISDIPTKRLKITQPLADYLGVNLSAFGISGGQVKVAPDIETMSRWIKSGEVDLYFDSIYPAMLVSDASGAQFFLRRWKGGDAEYRGIFITRADSGITSMDALKGHVIAFDDRFSTSGYFLPKAYLLNSGIQSVEKEAPGAEVAKDRVGYVFTNAASNTIQWVISGKVVAGVTDSRAFADLPQESRSALKVLAETQNVPRQIMLIRPGMDPALQEAIKNVLMGMDKTTAGQLVLKNFDKTARFDELPPAATLDTIRTLYKLVESK